MKYVALSLLSCVAASASLAHAQQWDAMGPDGGTITFKLIYDRI